MKHCLTLTTALIVASMATACEFNPIVIDPIDVNPPEPTETLTKVDLTAEQQGYVKSGNCFAFNCLAELCKNGNQSMVFSPLSLQFALAMAVNGASGDTAAEITRALGYGTDVDALNAYCKILLDQLPALDSDVTVKLTDAMIARQSFPVQDSFSKVLNDNYYAPVEYFNPSNIQEIVDRINEWAARNTNNLIKPFLNKDDITEDFVAAILNALYFKAKWAEGDNGPMFREESTLKNQEFYPDNGGSKHKVDLMRTYQRLPYAKRSGYSVVSIPYSRGKYSMYVLLPDEKGKDGAASLVKQLKSEKWEDITSSLSTDYNVNLRFPKFESESKFGLVETMQALGMKRAFVAQLAEFDRMFVPQDGYTFYVSNIIQKAKIKVAEWGTEAAAVTAIIMDKATAVAPGYVKEVDFIADHPFVYVIAERTSGAILFEGVYAGD